MGGEFAAFLPLLRAAVLAVEDAWTETFALLDAQALTPPHPSHSDLREVRTSSASRKAARRTRRAM
eukprot:2247836-Prymnesium_polylepis.1